MLRYTPPRQVPGVPERHLLYTGLPQASAPKHLHRFQAATLPPQTRPKANARPLPVFCCPCCCTPAMTCWPRGLLLIQLMLLLLLSPETPPNHDTAAINATARDAAVQLLLQLQLSSYC